MAAIATALGSRGLLPQSYAFYRGHIGRCKLGVKFLRVSASCNCNKPLLEIRNSTLPLAVRLRSFLTHYYRRGSILAPTS